MCGLYTKSTTVAWLESQVGVLDCWIEDVSTNPEADINLLECIQGHRKWLGAELQVLKDPDKYRLSGFAKQTIYPLISNAQIIVS